MPRPDATLEPAPLADPHAEWLEADGLGGFASGTVSAVRTRRYHGLLLAARRPPSDRVMLVNGVEAFVERGERRFALTSQAYHPDVVYPDGRSRIVAFDSEPWPRWRFRLADGTEIEHELFARHGSALVLLSWRVVAGDARGTRLWLRPLVSGRDFHGSLRENGALRLDIATDGESHRLRLREHLPPIRLIANARFDAAPDWYRNFRYDLELERGLDDREDLASPGVFTFDLAGGRAVLALSAEGIGEAVAGRGETALALWNRLSTEERARRERFASALDRAADQYRVRRGGGRTIIAGYPWFGDWGRDTFIALRGLCLATGRLDDARSILLEWSGAVSEGMLPNRFPDHGEAPEYNSVDASLWFVVAVHHFLETAGRGLARADRESLGTAVVAILDGYTRGTRFGIRADADGLLACGAPGVQLTWMDARVGDRVITPRAGKPVEIEALWINALEIGARFEKRFASSAAQARRSFAARFWNAEAHALFDVVDVDHVAGAVDATLRPNQVFAAGGLPFPVIDGQRARAVVDAVELRLLTPLGLRSLERDDPRFSGRYLGGPSERDATYHQGPVWPWLIGAFVDAWVRTHGGTRAAKQEARARFRGPRRARHDGGGPGPPCEIGGRAAPPASRGAPFQAWSLGEFLWADRVVTA